MRIDSIELTHFRNIESLELQFNPDINIFIGKNGQGKTNIIESFYLLSLCRSFRTRQMNQMIQFKQPYAKVSGKVVSNRKNISLEVILTQKNKKAKVNHQDISKVSDFVGYLNVVVFTPDDLSLIKNGPNQRRRLIDVELSKVSPIYLFNLSKYNKLLKERNAYLKIMKEKNINHDLYLDVLNEQMADIQNSIILKREQFVSNLSNKASHIYHLIANNGENISLKYHCFVHGDNLGKQIIEQYQKHLAQDIQQASTTVGIHKDDMKIEINSKSASLYGSQGQQRTIVLAIKIALLELVKEEIGEYPILLLDDVLSELDRSRKKMLLSLLDENVQTFITTTSMDDIDFEQISTARVYEIENGRLKEEYVYE